LNFSRVFLLPLSVQHRRQVTRRIDDSHNLNLAFTLLVEDQPPFESDVRPMIRRIGMFQLNCDVIRVFLDAIANLLTNPTRRLGSPVDMRM
jgi:hypothetical protein